MPIRYLFDHNVHAAIARGLERRGIDTLTAYEDGSHELDDPPLLSRAADLGRVLFTNDDDLLIEATARQRNRDHFAGVVYAHQNHLSIGRVIDDLEILAEAGEPEDFSNRVVFLPLTSDG